MSNSPHHDPPQPEEPILQDVLDGLSEEEILVHSRHLRLGRAILLLRNIAVGLAVVLFILTLFAIPQPYLVMGLAYFLGAAAYFLEILLLTDCFSKRVPHQEMFMAYCFGPMYLLLGLSYLLRH